MGGSHRNRGAAVDSQKLVHAEKPLEIAPVDASASTGKPRGRAAEYMRMSTDRQEYSIANQSALIQEYANEHNFEIVRTFVDRGKSGLTLDGRPGLQELLRVVAEGKAEFSAVLVYDVSRWGRFQDVDESAHYEYLLKKAGVPVIYCAEPFGDTGRPTDALIKTLKRAMAAEYSRELSVKVTAGLRRVAQSGFRTGGIGGIRAGGISVSSLGEQKHRRRNKERKSGKSSKGLSEL
jgi:DNA invertase Pin-like site-specific DNA recombinase